MTFRTLELGYNVRRAKLDDCEGLNVFSHHLDCFSFPFQHADRLALAYKQYLIGASILDWISAPSFEEENFNEYRCIIEFFYEKERLEFVPSEFSLGAAIDFVYMETKVPKKIAIRWCMMKEYIIWEDQQHYEKQERKKCDAPEVSLVTDDQTSAA